MIKNYNLYIIFKNSMKLITSIPGPIYTSSVVHRPSKICKTPYIADIIDPLDASKIVQAHTPALGCGGHINCECTVYLLPSNNPKNVSKYSIIGANIKSDPSVRILSHPNWANFLMSNILSNKLWYRFENLSSIKSEPKISEHTRFDFSGLTSEGKTCYIEVKCVPLAESRAAIFPYDGSKKPKLISERALKHINTLKELCNTCECYLVYVVMRDDVDCLKISEYDPTYRAAVSSAKDSGVQILAFNIKWIDKEIYFDRELEIIF